MTLSTSNIFSNDDLVIARKGLQAVINEEFNKFLNANIFGFGMSSIQNPIDPTFIGWVSENFIQRITAQERDRPVVENRRVYLDYLYNSNGSNILVLHNKKNNVRIEIQLGLMQMSKPHQAAIEVIFEFLITFEFMKKRYSIDLLAPNSLLLTSGCLDSLMRYGIFLNPVLVINSMIKLSEQKTIAYWKTLLRSLSQISSAYTRSVNMIAEALSNYQRELFENENLSELHIKLLNLFELNNYCAELPVNQTEDTKNIATVHIHIMTTSLAYLTMAKGPLDDAAFQVLCEDMIRCGAYLFSMPGFEDSLYENYTKNDYYIDDTVDEVVHTQLLFLEENKETYKQIYCAQGYEKLMEKLKEEIDVEQYKDPSMTSMQQK